MKWTLWYISWAAWGYFLNMQNGLEFFYLLIPGPISFFPFILRLRFCFLRMLPIIKRHKNYEFYQLVCSNLNIASWAEARIKIARMTLTIKLDGNWNSFQLANNTPPLSVTGSVIAPSARMAVGPNQAACKNCCMHGLTFWGAFSYFGLVHPLTCAWFFMTSTHFMLLNCRNEYIFLSSQ